MPKVEVDQDLCIGCGQCVQQCEDCFELDPTTGKSHYKNPETTTCDVREVALNCPVQAIIVKKDE